MGTPWVELPRDTIRHACGVAHVVSLTRPTATFHPRPIAGSGFYASACLFRSIPSQGYGLTEAKKNNATGDALEQEKGLGYGRFPLSS
jgi:hypothetical protein